MNDLLLSDCIRSTPARTLGALLFVGGRRLGAAFRRTVTADPIRGVDDRTLNDIGLSRFSGVDGAHLSTGRA